MNSLILDGLSVKAGERQVATGLSMEIAPGEVHVLMGRNGSGKSSLANALISKPGYSIISGGATICGADLLSMDATGRSRSGLFVASQYPLEVPGLSNGQFLRTMANGQAERAGRAAWSAGDFLTEAKKCCAKLGISDDFLKRNLNSGMSGGERKRNELLQLRFFEPKFVILDEIDSGLDVDAWSHAVDFISGLQSEQGFGMLVISHYAKMAERFPSARVHLLADGFIAKSGGVELARQVEDYGFAEASQ